MRYDILKFVVFILSMGGGNSCFFWEITWIMYGKTTNFKMSYIMIYILYHLERLSVRFTPTKIMLN